VQSGNAAPLAMATGLVGMVDAMKQFDANGQMLVPTGAMQATVPSLLKTQDLLKPSADILAPSK
jgi:hypothetical protein